MAKSDLILNLMVSHHGLLEILLTVAEDDLGRNTERAREALDNFQWELEKHIFGEEKVAFKNYKVEDLETHELVKKLESEHAVMLETIDALKNGWETKTKADIAEFREFMVKHRELEEKDFYHKLDQILSEATKEEIVARINEIPIKK